MSNRIRDVQVECRDALVLLDEFRMLDHAVIYVDPPYTTGGNLYTEQVDRDRLFELLADPDNRAKILVSGYEDDPWTGLGWGSRMLPRTTTTWTPDGARVVHRTEYLWTNYEFVGQQQLGGLRYE